MEVHKEWTHYANFAIWHSFVNGRDIYKIMPGGKSIYLTKHFDMNENNELFRKWCISERSTYFNSVPKEIGGFTPLHRKSEATRWIYAPVIAPLADVYDVLGQKVEISSIDGDIFETEKGTKILINSNEKEVLNIVIPTGYRGHSEILRFENVDKVVKYHIYESPRGSLGVSECALVIVPKNVQQFKIEFKASGRRVSINHGIMVIERIEGNKWKINKFKFTEYNDLSELDI